MVERRSHPALGDRTGKNDLLDFGKCTYQSGLINKAQQTQPGQNEHENTQSYVDDTCERVLQKLDDKPI